MLTAQAAPHVPSLTPSPSLHHGQACGPAPAPRPRAGMKQHHDKQIFQRWREK